MAKNRTFLLNARPWYLQNTKEDLAIAIRLITSLLEELRDGGEVSPDISKLVDHVVYVRSVRSPASEGRGTGGVAFRHLVLGS